MKLIRVKTPARAIEKTVEIVKNAGEDLDKKIFVFSESRASLSYELAVSNALNGSFSTRIMSFSRYVSLNFNADKYLGKTAATLVVRKIIEEDADDLVRFKRGTANLAVNVYNVISQLKAAKVSVVDVEDIIEKSSGAFKSKLKDIAYVYRAYEKFLTDGGYIDENGYLSLMPDLLRKDDSVRGAKVIVSGISNMTKKTVDILLTLEKISDLTVVTVSHDSAGYSNEIYYKVLSLFDGCDVEDDLPLPRENQAIIDGVFDPFVFKKVGLYSDKVRIFEHPDVNAEAHAVAKRIRYEVVTNNYRYGDFVIASANVAAYAPLYRRVFAEYDIPLYADVKKGLSTHPLATLITGLIDVKRLNFRPDVCLAVVKNPYAFSAEEADAFENYLLKVTPSRRMMAKPFSDKAAESVRQKLFGMCAGILPKNTVNGYIDHFLQVFDTLGTSAVTQKLSDRLSGYNEDELAGYNTVAEKSVLSALEETRAVMGGYVASIELFKSLISSAISATEVSIIATHYDSVFFGDTKTAPLRTAKVLFAVGFDSGVPDVRADTSLLCDKELIKLENYKCVIEPKLKVVNTRERENVLCTLASFSDKLMVSFARLGAKGEKNVRSEVIDYLERIFDIKTRLPEDEKNAHIGDEEDVTDYLSSRSALKGALKEFEAFKHSKTDNIALATAYERYAKISDKPAYTFINDYFSNEEGYKTSGLDYKGKISATMVETYFSCPYKAFGERVLRLKELSTGDTAAFEIGLIFHDVLEKFAPVCKDIDINDVEKVSGGIVDKVLEKEDYARYLNKKQYEYIFAIVKKEIVATCKRVYNDLKESDFTVWGTEMKFSNEPGSPFKAIRINTVNGVKQVTGIIDRVDRYGDSVRIIDYKTGRAEDKASAESLYTGTSIQLYLYMNAIGGDNKLAAAHYMQISDAYTEEGGSAVNYIGNVLADDDIVKRLDKTSVGGDSVKYSVKHNSKGEFDRYAKVLSDSEMKAYTRYAIMVTESGANDIYGGFFIPSPYKESACEYCRLKGMCGYDCETGGTTRKFGPRSIDKQAIINATIKGDVDND